MPSNLFVSYSHQDSTLIIPVVKLLRINQELVFYDTDTIKPGKKWQEQINDSLTNANLILVFWCSHSSQSEEVKKEYSYALQQGKDVLPVLLDATPLPDELAEFQWIDFKGLVTHVATTPKQNSKPDNKGVPDNTWDETLPLQETKPQVRNSKSLKRGYGLVLLLFVCIAAGLATYLSHYSADMASPVSNNLQKDTLTPSVLYPTDSSVDRFPKDINPGSEGSYPRTTEKERYKPGLTETNPTSPDPITPISTVIFILFGVGSLLMIFIVAVRSWLKPRSRAKLDLPTKAIPDKPSASHTRLAAVLEMEILRRISPKE